MKLNLGCGQNSKPGFLNVDKFAECEPDEVVDLERFPWPWPDSSADEILLVHVLEHLGRETETYFGVIREIYRVAKPDAAIRIVVPDPRSDAYLNDPTHVRPITPPGLELFNQAKNREWREKNQPNSPLGVYLGVDLRIESANMTPAEPWRTRFQRREITAADLAQAARQFNNVVAEWTIVLRAKKPAGG